MRTAGLLLGLCLLAFLFAPAPAQAAWCQGPEGAYWCGDPEACPGICNEPGSDCTTACKRLSGTWTTCGGGPANDADSDGVSDASDNCLCTANSNQANCDQDSMGDVCDPVDQKWVPTNIRTYCDWDADWHFGYGEIEQYGTRSYRELCTNATCNNIEFIQEKRCYEPFDDDYCCEIHFGQQCLTDNQCPADTCSSF